ncbi:MAG: hypothetical protein LC793_18335 [Thermomicrobia bacterium]|nr:hypothetical protein [Thermomicrobia bacterium]MCA1724709.1 hypothetical protein [Thermomicrobia bacterium]
MIERRMRCLLVCVTILALLGVAGSGVNAAADFAAPVFRFQWESVELNVPNFWGPLANAGPGIEEPYAEAAGGQRLVQYFDKARMELAGPNSVTNGLLTVELKTGRVQMGNDSFEQRIPATIGLAGDPEQAGPTYADLAKLPERAPQVANHVLTTTYANGAFIQSNVVPTDPQLALLQYVTDPGGRFGQYVPRAFWDYLNGLPLPWQSAVGFPISPAFGAQLSVGGVSRPVFMQAFERRVLTYTPGNPAGFTVEFGNIGQHYAQWRYNQARPAPIPPPPPVVATTAISGADALFATGVTNLTGKNSSVFPLGAATGTAYDETLTFQPFENGFMFYMKSERVIYVLSKTGVQLSVYADTWNEGDPNGALTPGPRPDTYAPKRGFGKVWREHSVVQQAIGYATTDEQPYTGKVQFFARGLLIDDPSGGLVWALNTAIGVWDNAPR